MIAYLKCGHAEEILDGYLISFRAIEGPKEICHPCLISKENYIGEGRSGLAKITLLEYKDDMALIEMDIDDLRSSIREYAAKRFYVSKKIIIESLSDIQI